MSELRKKMIQWMRRKNYSEATIRSYVCCVSLFARHYKRCPSKLTDDDIAAYLDYLKGKKGYSQSSLNAFYSGIKVLWEQVLLRQWNGQKLPRGRRAKTLPEILSVEEIKALFSATRNVKHQTILKLLYRSGIRVGELVKLKPEDIDSHRMVIRVRQGKGKKDRYTVLSKAMLEELRTYWKRYRPARYLFEGMEYGEHISIRTVQKVFQNTKIKAGIKRKVSLHVLRHCFATHLLDKGVDTLTVKELLGHANLATTARYIHLQNGRLKRTPDLIDW